MPHIIVEQSESFPPETSPREVLQKLNASLSSFDSFKIEEIKSRWVKHKCFQVGAPGDRRGFVHLRLEILSGRPLELKKKAGAALLEILKNTYGDSAKNIAFSLEIRDMDRETYLKG